MDSGVVLSSSDARVWKLFCWCLQGLERFSFQHSFTVSVGRAFTPFWGDIIQTINMSQVERNIQHECDEESCSQDELLNTVETCGHPVWWSSGKINTFLLLYVKLCSWALLRNVSHCMEMKKSTTRVDECAFVRNIQTGSLMVMKTSITQILVKSSNTNSISNSFFLKLKYKAASKACVW